MERQDDWDIVAEVLAGHVNAFEILVNRYQKPIFNLTYRMTGSYSDASDLAQETFIKAFEQLHRFQAGKRFFPWLYTIALNHSRNFLRTNRPGKLVPLEDGEAVTMTSSNDESDQDLCARLDGNRCFQALGKLPEETREALILRYREDLSMEEVAGVLKISVSGAKMRIHRGLKRLREILDHHT